jgi:ADP-ribosyl-[dinitrogen reductase] hydrolase
MISGSCLCGVVRYEIAAAGPTYHCHCGACRKWSGSAFASSMRAPMESLRLVSGAEDLSRYESSPGVMRCFCRRCGSSVLTERHDKGLVHIRLGTTDGDPACDRSSTPSSPRRRPGARSPTTCRRSRGHRSGSWNPNS